MRSKNFFHPRTIISSYAAGAFIFTMTFAAAASGWPHMTGDPAAAVGAPVLAPAPVPFPGPEPKNLPAILEAENFDRGGEGAGYHEVSGAAGSGLYRNRPVEGVDIQAFSGASSGFVVTETVAGEWLSYTIFAAAAGGYELGVRYTSVLRGGSFHAEIDGQNVTGAMIAAATGPNFRTLFKRVDLTAGQHTLRLVMDGNSTEAETGSAASKVCEFDSISFRALKGQVSAAAQKNSVSFQNASINVLAVFDFLRS